MIEYVTTNIRLPKEIYREAKLRALEEEKSLAQIIRESVVRYLVSPRLIEPRPAASADAWENDPLWLIGADNTVADVTDGAANHDRYIYGPLSVAARSDRLVLSFRARITPFARA